jgi:hypothetical protein
MSIHSASSFTPEHLKDYSRHARVPVLLLQPSVGIAGVPI